MSPLFELRIPEHRTRRHLSILSMRIPAWSEAEARRIASEQAGAEGAAIWLEGATCALFTPRAEILELLAGAREARIWLDNRDTLEPEGHTRLARAKEREAQLEELCREYGFIT